MIGSLTVIALVVGLNYNMTSDGMEVYFKQCLFGIWLPGFVKHAVPMLSLNSYLESMI